MREEIEVQKIYNEFELKAGVHIGTEERLIIQAINEGFQKGKLEQKKEELKRIIELQKKIRRYLIDNSRCDCLEWTTKYGDISDVLFWEYEKQLQKEIGGMK